MTAETVDAKDVPPPRKSRLSPEKLEKIQAAADRWLKEPDLTMKELAASTGIPERTLFYHFEKTLGIKRGKHRGSPAEKQVREVEVQALSDEAEKLTTIAIGLGGVIARRYLPLIDSLLAGGKTLEMIAEDVMGWFEMKKPTESRITLLEQQIDTLHEQVKDAYKVAMPNFRYMLRAQIIQEYAKHILVARMYGVRVPVQPTLRALQNDLVQVEKDLELIQT